MWLNARVIDTGLESQRISPARSVRLCDLGPSTRPPPPTWRTYWNCTTSKFPSAGRLAGLHARLATPWRTEVPGLIVGTIRYHLTPRLRLDPLLLSVWCVRLRVVLGLPTGTICYRRLPLGVQIRLFWRLSQTVGGRRARSTDTGLRRPLQLILRLTQADGMATTSPNTWAVVEVPARTLPTLQRRRRHGICRTCTILHFASVYPQPILIASVYPQPTSTPTTTRPTTPDPDRGTDPTRASP